MSFMDRQVHGMLSCDALCILLHLVLAVVLLEVLLGNSVEGERGNRTFEEGVVIPHVQCEQHRPLKSSPSTWIKCLFIYLPLCVRLDSSWSTAEWKTSMQSKCGR